MTRTEEPEIVALARGLGHAVFQERSVKFRPGARDADRVLLAIPVRRARAGLHGDAIGLWRRLGLGGEALAELDRLLPAAHVVYFGQDGLGPAAARKAYLEFPEPPPGLPDVRFVAWKWRAGQAPLRALYRSLPTPDAGAMRQTLDAFEMAAEVRPLADRLVALAADRVDPATLQLLDVEDEGTPRRSFDLNIYDADITLGEVADVLGAALDALGHDPGAPGFPGRERLGHLSAGVGRDGTPFLTLYADKTFRPPLTG